MNTRNRFGHKDWHLYFTLFNINYTDDEYVPNWVYLLQIGQDETEGCSLFSYKREDFCPESYTIYLSLFWCNFAIEKDVEEKHVELTSYSHKWLNIVFHHVWNKWKFKEYDPQE